MEMVSFNKSLLKAEARIFFAKSPRSPAFDSPVNSLRHHSVMPRTNFETVANGTVKFSYHVNYISIKDPGWIKFRDKHLGSATLAL
jgi:hypothetical protein